MSPLSLCFGSSLSLDDISMETIYAVQAPPAEATQHQRNLTSELVLNGCDRAFATKIVLERGEDRAAVWREVAKALEAGTLPASLELPVGRGLDSKQWAQVVLRRREKLTKFVSAAVEQPVTADPEEADDVLRAFEACGSLDRKKVVAVLRVSNEALEQRFLKQHVKLGEDVMVEQLFFGAASVQQAEEIAVKGFKAVASGGTCLTLTKDSGACADGVAPAKKGWKRKTRVPESLQGCQTLVLSRVLVPIVSKGAMQHTMAVRDIKALPEYLIFYS